MPSFHDTATHAVSPSHRNPALERAQSQWLFTSDELLRTPSILDGIPVAQELANRQKGVNFITQVGIMLKLPQLTLATASVYLHRFFMRHAMAQANKPGLHHYSVAATALFLATKVEENYRKMRELVVACCRVAQKQPNLVVDEQSKEYWKWRDTILHNEDLLLEALCFDLQLEQPYRILMDFLRFYRVQENKNLRNTSWAFLNDSHVTTLCLQMGPRAVAGAALYMGIKFADIALPDDDMGRPWWEQLDLDVRDIQRACNILADVYENPALPRQGQKDAYTKDDDMSLFEKTRQATTPLPDRSPATSTRSGSLGIKRDRAYSDGRNSVEWGSTAPPAPVPHDAQLRPSPKRQRRDSRDDDDRGPTYGAQAQHSAGPRPPVDRGASIDDVQRRIDQIVSENPSSARVPRPNLARRPSDRQSYQSDHTRGRSSSVSNWQPSQMHEGNGHGNRNPPFPRESSTPERRPSYESARLPSRLPPPPEPLGQRPQEAAIDPVSNGINDIDDAEKVDYGSEEGEL